MTRHSSIAPATGARDQYAIRVVAPNVEDVVAKAGGWLFDRSMSGWDVTAFVPAACDGRPLRVLGARVESIESGLLGAGHLGRTPVLAVSAAICRADERVRDLVVAAACDGRSQLVTWGDTWLPDVQRGTTAAIYLPSRAASAFKARALTVTAIGPAQSMAYPEEFRVTGVDVAGARVEPSRSRIRCAAKHVGVQ